MTIFKAHSSPNLKFLYIRYIILPSEIVNITSNNIVDLWLFFLFLLIFEKKKNKFKVWAANALDETVCLQQAFFFAPLRNLEHENCHYRNH